MSNITESQRSILQQLIYPESYHHIREETGLSPGEVRDDLTTLLHLNMIEVYEGFGGNIGQKVRHFDNDHPESFFYRATKSGLNAMHR
ncbi:hypothetical protein QA596_09930 [Balneolales bacterium ANBcel1]|nr:hypothetical protein [Balneolales bacterium ANBcel1]